LDVRKAFDSIDHPTFCTMASGNNIHPLLVLAVLREWAGAQADFWVQQFSSEVPLLAGGRQGGRDTPLLWNVFLHWVIKDLVQGWEERNLCWYLPPDETGAPRLNVLIWADDILLFANSKVELALKIRELAVVLRCHRLDIKPDSLEWMTGVNQQFYDRGDIVCNLPSKPLCVKYKESMNILGILLDARAKCEPCWKFRHREAVVHWMSRREQLMRRGVPMRARITRWMATVAKTLLWGAGAWSLNFSDICSLNAFQLGCFRSMSCRKPRPGEEYEAFVRRLTHWIRAKLTEWDVELVGHIALRLQHSWAGHAARLENNHFLHDLLRFVPRTSRGRRALWGRPTEWEWRLVDYHGVKWYDLAYDREVWRNMGWNFVAGRLWESGVDEVGLSAKAPCCWQAKFVKLLGNPLPLSLKGIRLVMVGSSELSMNLVLGKAKPGVEVKSLVRRIQQGHFLITQTQQATGVGSEGCFFIDPDNTMCKQLAEACAKNQTDMKEVTHFVTRAGDTIIAYWDRAKIKQQNAVAVVFYAAMKDSSCPELLGFVTKCIPNCEDSECDLMALYMLHDLILAGMGTAISPGPGMFDV
jgi:hypothetical protein